MNDLCKLQLCDCHNRKNDSNKWASLPQQMTEEVLLSGAWSGQLEEVIELSGIFKNDVRALSEALGLIGYCNESHLHVTNWLVEHTLADVNYKGNYYTPLAAACRHKHLNVIKYLVETSHVDVNLPDREGYTPLTIWHVTVSSCQCQYTCCARSITLKSILLLIKVITLPCTWQYGVIMKIILDYIGYKYWRRFDRGIEIALRDWPQYQCTKQ